MFIYTMIIITRTLPINIKEYKNTKILRFKNEQCTKISRNNK